MNKQTAVVIASAAGVVVTLFFAIFVTGKVGRPEPEQVVLRTHQDIANIFGCLVITNGLLAAILAALIY